MKKIDSVVLLSGGLDSATTLYLVKEKGYNPICLIFDYGQLHKKEVNCAKRIADKSGSKYILLKIFLPWKGSALLDKNITIDNGFENKKCNNRIPTTYVPARNIIFLSYAVSLAEVYGLRYIFYGANQVDYSGYPDCRLEFIESFKKMVNCGTKLGLERKRLQIIAPLLKMSKERIVKLAIKLKVPINLTWSCYRGLDEPCGKCDSCKFRAMGFEKAKVTDPLYVKNK